MMTVLGEVNVLYSRKKCKNVAVVLTTDYTDFKTSTCLLQPNPRVRLFSLSNSVATGLDLKKGHGMKAVIRLRLYRSNLFHLPVFDNCFVGGNVSVKNDDAVVILQPFLFHEDGG